MPPDLAAPEMSRKWATTQVDLVHGEHDPLVDPLSLERNERLLRDAHVPFWVHKFAGGHALDNEILRRLITA